jgi:uncharacterized protein (DUF983 family)
MFKKGKKLYSILRGLCPKCQEETMYVESNAYKLGSTLKMRERCSHCGVKYKLEPSFFYGAMYVSYGVGTAIAVTVFIIAFIFANLSLEAAFLAIVTTLVALFPLIMRWSRNIWINIFIPYNPNSALKK